VGFDWKLHIQRTRDKISKFLDIGYKIIIYTYPDLVKYFETFNIPVVTDIYSLNKVLKDI